MFLDEAKIEVAGGDGGAGCVSWRREKYVPKGGPDGGNGGQGGNVVIRADSNTDTLSDFSSRKKFEADKGAFGRGTNSAGKAAPEYILLVPPGTSITQIADDGTEVAVLADLSQHGDQIIVAYGGRGGYGNAHFVSSTRQRPDFAELGEPGERKKIKLELKLVADVGIIGFPSVGKSTLISVISSARPKIAAYEFTTLIPNLGVVFAADRSYVVCDLPGLIEGASEGKGLGDKFLKHIERCGVLLHLLDISRALEEGNEVNVDKLIADYKAIRKELIAYSPTLAEKKELVLLNKIDLINSDTTALVKKLKKAKIDIFMGISAAARLNTDDLIMKLLPVVLKEREKREKIVEEKDQKNAEELPVLKPQLQSEKMGAFKLTQKQDGTVMITGKRLEQFTKMTNFNVHGGLQRFRDVIDRVGVSKAIRHARGKEGFEEALVYIGGIRVDEYL